MKTTISSFSMTILINLGIAAGLNANDFSVAVNGLCDSHDLITLNNPPDCPCCPDGEIPWGLGIDAYGYSADLFVHGLGSGGKVIVNWGDSSVEDADEGEHLHHDYGDCGPYTVTIELYCFNVLVEASTFTTEILDCGPPDPEGFCEPTYSHAIDLDGQNAEVVLSWENVDNDDLEVVFCTIDWGNGNIEVFGATEPKLEYYEYPGYYNITIMTTCLNSEISLSHTEPIVICTMPNGISISNDRFNPNQYYFWPIPLPTDEDGNVIAPPCTVNPALEVIWTINGQIIASECFASRIMEEEGIYMCTMMAICATGEIVQFVQPLEVSSPGNNCPGDLDGNEMINIADLLQFVGVYGSVCN